MKQYRNRLLSLFLAFLVVFSCTYMNSSAAETHSVRASDYFASYNASLTAVGNGKIRISGNVEAPSVMSSIGISYFRVYLADGTFVTTVPGSTTNGLLVSQSDSYNGSFTYQAVSGNQYYVVITFICRNANGYDYRNYTTGTVTA